MMQGVVSYLAGVYELALPIKARGLLELPGEGQRLDGTARAQVLVYGDKLDANCALGSQCQDRDRGGPRGRTSSSSSYLPTPTTGARSKESRHAPRQRPDAPGFPRHARAECAGKKIALSKLPGMCDLSSSLASFR